MTQFVWHGRRLELFNHPYNTTIRNERAVEIAVAITWLAERRGRGLEVGNVLSHYLTAAHEIVDLHERAPGVRNIDVFDVDGTYDWVVSVSTMEHVHWDDERDPDAAAAAVGHLRGLLAPGGRMLVTVPLGWHPHLDQAIRTGALDAARDCVMVRCGGTWVQHTRDVWRPYGVSTPWAEAVWIGEW